MDKMIFAVFDNIQSDRHNLLQQFIPISIILNFLTLPLMLHKDVKRREKYYQFTHKNLQKHIFLLVISIIASMELVI